MSCFYNTLSRIHTNFWVRFGIGMYLCFLWSSCLTDYSYSWTMMTHRANWLVEVGMRWRRKLDSPTHLILTHETANRMKWGGKSWFLFQGLCFRALTTKIQVMHYVLMESLFLEKWYLLINVLLVLRSALSLCLWNFIYKAIPIWVWGIHNHNLHLFIVIHSN